MIDTAVSNDTDDFNSVVSEDVVEQPEDSIKKIVAMLSEVSKNVESLPERNTIAHYKEIRSISVIFPAYNEQENIARSIHHCREAMSKHFPDLEIIVVNDGSQDRTANIIDTIADSNNDVVVVHHEGNRGYGAALRSGFIRASKDLIFFTDADLQFDLNEVKKLIRWVPSYDIVSGYRRRRADPFHRRFNAWGWNRLVRMSLGLKSKDIDCAFKLFHREVIDRINLESAGAMINTEILYQADFLGMHLKELPISHYPRIEGEQTGASPKVILKALKELSGMRKKLKQLKRAATLQNTNTLQANYLNISS